MSLKSQNKIDTNRVELEVVVDAETFEKGLAAAFKKQSKKISIPGFRKGKAPRAFVEKYFGKEVFYEDAVNALYPDALDEAVKEAGLEVIQDKIDFDVKEVGPQGFTFTAALTTKPEVTIENYKGIEAVKKSAEVTDEDIDAEIKKVQERNSRMVTVEDRAAQNDDIAVIDFEGFLDGEPFEGGKGENYSLEIGSGSFVPGFEDQIIGLKAGDEKDLDITFPEDYVADLAGKAVVFKVKVKEVKESQLPTVDDEFAKDVSEFETLADFKKDLGEKLTQRRTAEAQNDFEQAILEQLVDNLEADIPNGMVETQLDKIMDEYAMRMSSQGMSMDDYLKMMGMTPEMMRASSKPAALNQVKTELALEAVAAAENLEITDEECEAEVNKLAEQYKLTAEQVKAAVSLDALKHDLRLQKASELVVAEAKVGEAPKKEEEAAEKPKKATRKKKTEEAAEESESAEKPKRTRKKKAEESAEEPKAE